MRTTINPHGTSHRVNMLAWLVLLGATVATLALGGCAPMNVEMGRKFDPGVLEQSLHTGDSTQTDVRKVLGEPFGTGRALMPFHESPRTVWSYMYQRGSIDVGTGANDSDMWLLFVFFDGDRFDGYMWNTAKLRSAK